MEGTTNISQLPTDNMYSSENIVMETNDANTQGNMQHPPQMQQQPMQHPPQMQQQPMQQPPMQQQPMQQPPMQQQPMHQQPMQQQPLQMQQQPMQQQTLPNVGGGAANFSRPASPQINYNNNNDPSLVQHLAGIQDANMLNNEMQLPSRDIPTNTNHFSQDQQTNPNWVPQEQTNYINNQVSQDMINQFSQQQNNILNNNDALYDQLKVPVIISILFFIYNFSTFDKSLFKHFPFLFNPDQNIQKSGLLVKSLLFGVGYFAINKGIEHFSKI